MSNLAAAATELATALSKSSLVPAHLRDRPESIQRIGDAIQECLDEQTKPYADRRLVVRRGPCGAGWGVFDRDSGEKLRPITPGVWFAKRSTALAAKATEVPS